MRNYKIILSFLSLILLQSCIKDDFIEDMVEAQLRITSTLKTLAVGDEFQFEKQYLNEIGQEEELEGLWSSTDTDILTITPSGLATAVSQGVTDISVEVMVSGDVITQSIPIEVGEETINSSISITGNIVTTSSYVLEGDFELSAEESDLKLSIADNYKASTGLPGFYVYLSNNRNSIANAKEIAEVKIFSGSHSYTIKDASITDYQFIVYYCKPFNIKVGEAELN